MEPVVDTTGGRVRGTTVGGTAVFKGIPYAAAPFGELRFAAPGPVPRWDGVRPATEFGPTAPKAPYAPPIDQLLHEPSIPGEDVLGLNVWSPDLSGSLPVIVWIHGGAFVHGSSAVALYDGANFARDGVVFVGINYRLGAEGFALLDDAPANRGLLDQVAALAWVRDNIAAFGGDPDRVTIAGESAGAMSVVSLLAMPAARGLFRRAIAQSGAGHSVMSAGTARTVAGALSAMLGVAPTRAAFAGIEPKVLVDAQERLTARIRSERDPATWGEIATDSMAFEPCVDGTVLPGRPIDLVGKGAGSDVDVLIGHNDDEMTLFFVPLGVDGLLDEAAARGLAAAYGLTDPEAFDAYRRARPDARPGDTAMHIVRDWMYRIPVLRVAEARTVHDAETHVYRFDWKSPLFDGRLGATHALDIGFVFDNLHLPQAAALAGSAPPQELATRMHRAWVDFATTGSPGWPPYGDERTEMLFGDTCATVDDHEADLRTLWDGIR
ncbi:carboxylesterase/lipase family protein [Rhodococcus rhodochrous]|uniref:carboxylesterase/lipase family protein n=1 Tax=Rhodococcus rhodochrous TaxID=1829 RepID=UPI00215B568A|nr:carboxylesterase family protein [Rhodococcus pyridinivorans]